MHIPEATIISPSLKDICLKVYISQSSACSYYTVYPFDAHACICTRFDLLIYVSQRCSTLKRWNKEFRDPSSNQIAHDASEAPVRWLVFACRPECLGGRGQEWKRVLPPEHRLLVRSLGKVGAWI